LGIGYWVLEIGDCQSSLNLCEIIGHPPSAIRHLPSATCHWPSAIGH
jgi:hypothetical protein